MKEEKLLDFLNKNTNLIDDLNHEIISYLSPFIQGYQINTFNYPDIIDITSDDKYLYLCDISIGKVRVIDENGKTIRIFGRETDNDDNDYPYSIAVDDKYVYIIDQEDEDIEVWYKNGKFSHQIGKGNKEDISVMEESEEESEEDKVESEEDKEESEEDKEESEEDKEESEEESKQEDKVTNSFIADSSEDTEKETIYSTGEFIHPTGIAVDEKYIYVCGWDDKIQVVDKKTGEIISSYWFKQVKPYSIKVDKDNVYVSDIENGQFNIIRKDKSILTTIFLDAIQDVKSRIDITEEYIYIIAHKTVLVYTKNGIKKHEWKMDVQNTSIHIRNDICYLTNENNISVLI